MSAGKLSRRFLPAAILAPCALALVIFVAQRGGMFSARTALALIAASTMGMLVAVVWWAATVLRRLDKDRHRTGRRLAFQYTVTRLLAESTEGTVTIPKVMQAICESLGWQVAALWEIDRRSNSLTCTQVWSSALVNAAEFEEITRHAVFPPGVELPGRIWSSGQPAWIPELAQDKNFPRSVLAEKVGLHSGLGFPIRLGKEILGILEFFSRAIEQPDQELLDMLAAAGSQIGQVIERQRTEDDLRNSETLYRSLVDTLPISVSRKDLAGKVTFANKRCCELLGRSLNELKGKTDFELFPRALAEKYTSDDRKVAESRGTFHDVELNQTPDGQRRFMEVWKAPVLDAAQKVIGTQVIFWDVSERHTAEEALARTATELTRSNQELDRFAQVASHDLQEPLRLIISYTQLLAKRCEGRLDGESAEYVGFVVDGALRMQQLLSDLLAYSRVQTRTKPFELVPCERLFENARHNLAPSIEEAGAEITHEPLPEVRGDAAQLLQVFQHLLNNALKFRGKERPQIHVSVTQQCLLSDQPQLACDDYVFCVRDNGIGIEAKYLPRLFTAFTRLHTRAEYPGSGIGLAICKKIVDRHHGRIWVESEPGAGARFYFSLPVPK